jgi:lipopolysaccharide transport system ATP-binding protein
MAPSILFFAFSQRLGVSAVNRLFLRESPCPPFLRVNSHADSHLIPRFLLLSLLPETPPTECYDASYTKVIEFQSVSKSFRGTQAKLLRVYVQEFFRNKPDAPFFALRDVSFRLGEGESLAVVGRNGAGKSTLLGLVAGLAQPNAGRIDVRGRVAALLELGSGFHPELTGIENLRLNASLLGLSRKKTDDVFDEIIAFSEIGDFVREPLRTYSSGMIVRLAFSVAIHVDPDILIVDEVLAVGDQGFQAKCFARIRQFRDAGKTLLFVSHAPGVVKELCDRALWLDHGRVRMDGAAGGVLKAYSDWMFSGAAE